MTNKLARAMAGESPYGNHKFGGATFGGGSYGGNTFGGAQFGASATSPAPMPSSSPAYLQPFQGLHNEPYKLPPFVQPGAFSQSALPPFAPPDVRQATAVPQMPPSVPIASPQPQGPGPLDPGAMPSVSSIDGRMPFANQFAPRNSLEADYYAKLAADPDGFNKGWLGRVLG